MKNKNKIIAIFICISLNSNTITPAFADKLDDNITLLSEILHETKVSYKDYVDKKFKSDIKTHFLQRLSDYWDAFQILLEMQETASNKSEQLKNNWDLKMQEIMRATPASFSESVLKILLIQKDLEDELVTLRNVRSDLSSISEFWKTRCANDRLQWALDRNQPKKIFVLPNLAALLPPQEDCTISIDSAGEAHSQGGTNAKGVVGSLAGAAAGTAVKLGVLKGLVATSAAGPVGAVVAVAVLAVWSSIDSAIESGKISRQWELIQEIRQHQIRAISAIDEGALLLITAVCEDFLLPEFEPKIQAALELNSEHLNQVVAYVESIKGDWQGLKNRWSELMSDLEDSYFPHLEDAVLTELDKSYSIRQQESRASFLFIKQGIAPYFFQLREPVIDRGSVLQNFWTSLVIGDALFSRLTSDPWESLKPSLIGRALQ